VGSEMCIRDRFVVLPESVAACSVPGSREETPRKTLGATLPGSLEAPGGKIFSPTDVDAVYYADCPRALPLLFSSVLPEVLSGSGPAHSSRNSGCGANDAVGSYSTLSTSDAL